MGLALQLPSERYTETKNFDDLTPEEQDVFWQSTGPMLELPGMRDHYPEAAADYDAWRQVHPEITVPSPEEQTPISPAAITELPGEAAMQKSPFWIYNDVVNGQQVSVETSYPDPKMLTHDQLRDYQLRAETLPPDLSIPAAEEYFYAIEQEQEARRLGRSEEPTVAWEEAAMVERATLPQPRELSTLLEPPQPTGTVKVLPGVGDVDAYIAANPRREGEALFEWQSRICEGLPPDVKHAMLFQIREQYPPVDYIVEGAQRWRAEHGLPEPAIDIAEIPAPRLKGDVVAKFFELTPDQSDDPRVQAAFYAFKRQNEEMWDFMTRPESEGGLGIKITFTPYEAGDPYPTAEAQAEDLRVNHHMTTQAGLGGEHAATMAEDEYNRFRAVHDVFGHAGVGGGFDRHGEYQAYLMHSSMYTDDGRRAMASEYHGVNTAVWAGAPGSPGTGRSILLPEELIPLPWAPDGTLVTAAAGPSSALIATIQRKALGLDRATMEAIDYLIVKLGLVPPFAHYFEPPFMHQPGGKP
jgi:hypothetical protein